MSRQFKLSVLLIVAAVLQLGCGGASDVPKTELQRVKSGDMTVVLLSNHAVIQHGRDSFVIEFRNAGGQLVNVGSVRLSATMPMPGMPMFGTIEVQPTAVPGRYAANSDFGMAGTWRMSLEWDGPAGRGSVSFAGTVQ